VLFWFSETGVLNMNSKQLYNAKRNAQVFNLFIYLFCLTYFGLSLSPSPEADASEDGLKVSPKHVRQNK
jgi:hypothetical protein